ncbi:hypothetical protein B566_EDAN003637 [Ephemera danica]|nr:hypothetical protein B566_EDAN003637 [Ephemera danica]
MTTTTEVSRWRGCSSCCCCPAPLVQLCKRYAASVTSLSWVSMWVPKIFSGAKKKYQVNPNESGNTKNENKQKQTNPRISIKSEGRRKGAQRTYTQTCNCAGERERERDRVTKRVIRYQEKEGSLSITGGLSGEAGNSISRVITASIPQSSLETATTSFNYHKKGPQQVSLRKLSTGATFGGDAIVFDVARDAAVVTQAGCEILRVDQHDFRTIWEVGTAAEIYSKTFVIRRHCCSSNRVFPENNTISMVVKKSVSHLVSSA